MHFSFNASASDPTALAQEMSIKPLAHVVHDGWRVA